MSRSFENLDVWKRACTLSVNMYKELDSCKNYSLKDQMLRSALSIPSNIAEGSERDSDPDFCRFLNIAKGSVAELRTQLYISQKIKLLSEDKIKDLIEETRIIMRMIQSLINSELANFW